MMSVFVRGIGLDLAALRQRRLGQQLRHVAGLRVAQGKGLDAELAGQRLGVGQLALIRLLVGQHRERRDAHDRAVDRPSELVAAKNRVERLIPRALR